MSGRACPLKRAAGSPVYNLAAAGAGREPNILPERTRLRGVRVSFADPHTFIRHSPVSIDFDWGPEAAEGEVEPIEGAACEVQLSFVRMHPLVEAAQIVQYEFSIVIAGEVY